jgi:prepilin-type N-terminal cleavage/methylation domain-containing protein
MINVQNEGYTILEVMIVIAISASMFLFVSVTFSGRQQQVQFTQAVRDFDSSLNDIVNDVSTGYFPKNDTRTCELTVVDPRPEFNTVAPSDLGANDDCVSIGKVIQFSPQFSPALDNDNDQYLNVYSVAGLRNDDSGKTPVSIEDSVPTADPDAQTLLLNWGLKVTKIIRSDAPTIEYGGLGIFTSLNRGSQLQSSASNEDLRINVIPVTTLDMSESDFIDQIDTIDDKINAGLVDFSSRPEIIICVSDFDEERRAYLALGGNNIGNTLEFDEVEICNP